MERGNVIGNVVKPSSLVGHRCLQIGISLREIYSNGFLDNVRINYKTRKVAPGTKIH